MSLARKLYVFAVLSLKISIIILSLVGIFSILKQISRTSTNLPEDILRVEERRLVPADKESRRDRLYEKRLELSQRICQEEEAEITLHTVKMYDLVQPAPIGREQYSETN